MPRRGDQETPAGAVTGEIVEIRLYDGAMEERWP